MKKLFVLLAMTVFSTTGVFAASTLGTNLKNAVKQDIQTSVGARKEANANAAAQKKEQKIKELNAKLADLNKEKAAIQKDKSITEVQRALKLDKVQKQIDFYTKQKAALK